MSKTRTGYLIRLFCVFLFLLVCNLIVFSQKQIKGIVADSLSHKALPFATVRANKQNVTITGINGQFSLTIPPGIKQIEVSYISYTSRSIELDLLKENDTIFLSPAVATLGEVIVKPQTDKIRRIINAAVRNKSRHNPELYDLYECNIYYKMRADMMPSGIAIKDSSKVFRKEKPKKVNSDSSANVDTVETMDHYNSHLAFSETYSKRFYQRPQQLQEVIIASRFSGFKKTYFTNLITNILPFHDTGEIDFHPTK